MRERPLAMLGRAPSSNVPRAQLVLFFSVALQLASFFAAVSIGLWIAKAGHGSWKSLAEHGNVYLAAFIVMLLVSGIETWMVFVRYPYNFSLDFSCD